MTSLVGGIGGYAPGSGLDFSDTPCPQDGAGYIATTPLMCLGQAAGFDSEIYAWWYCQTGAGLGGQRICINSLAVQCGQPTFDVPQSVNIALDDPLGNFIREWCIAWVYFTNCGLTPPFRGAVDGYPFVSYVGIVPQIPEGYSSSTFSPLCSSAQPAGGQPFTKDDLITMLCGLTDEEKIQIIDCLKLVSEYKPNRLQDVAAEMHFSNAQAMQYGLLANMIFANKLAVDRYGRGSPEFILDSDDKQITLHIPCFDDNCEGTVNDQIFDMASLIQAVGAASGAQQVEFLDALQIPTEATPEFVGPTMQAAQDAGDIKGTVKATETGEPTLAWGPAIGGGVELALTLTNDFIQDVDMEYAVVAQEVCDPETGHTVEHLIEVPVNKATVVNGDGDTVQITQEPLYQAIIRKLDQLLVCCNPCPEFTYEDVVIPPDTVHTTSVFAKIHRVYTKVESNTLETDTSFADQNIGKYGHFTWIYDGSFRSEGQYINRIREEFVNERQDVRFCEIYTHRGVTLKCRFVYQVKYSVPVDVGQIDYIPPGTW